MHQLSIIHRRPDISQVHTWVTQTKLMRTLPVSQHNYFQRNEELEHDSEEWIQFPQFIRTTGNTMQHQKIKGDSRHRIITFDCNKSSQATFPGQKHRVISSAAADDGHRPKDCSSQSRRRARRHYCDATRYIRFVRTCFHMHFARGCVLCRGVARVRSQIELWKQKEREQKKENAALPTGHRVGLSWSNGWRAFNVMARCHAKSVHYEAACCTQLESCWLAVCVPNVTTHKELWICLFLSLWSILQFFFLQ